MSDFDLAGALHVSPMAKARCPFCPGIHSISELKVTGRSPVLSFRCPTPFGDDDIVAEARVTPGHEAFTVDPRFTFVPEDATDS